MSQYPNGRRPAPAGRAGQYHTGAQRSGGRSAAGPASRANGYPPRYGDPRRAQPPRRQPPRRRRRVDKTRLFTVCAIFAIIIGIAAFFVNAVAVVGVGNNTFYSGVSVNGIQLGGYTYEEAVTLVETRTDEWLSRTYTFTWNGMSWDFNAKMIGAKIDVLPKVRLAYNIGHVGGLFERKSAIESLKEHPVSYTAAIEYDEALLDAFIAGIAEEIDVPPVEAVVIIDEVNPVVASGSQDGLALNREWLRENILSLLNTGEGETQLLVEVDYPDLSTEEAYACTELVVYYQTDTTFRNYQSTGNVRLALDNFNGFSLYPGESFSFNSVVGPRTIERGYVEAVEYAGTRTQMGIGGGVCQASSTLYGALLQAGMTVVERGNHTMTVTYVPPSIDAAVEYGSKDLVMRNDTEYPIYVYTNVSGGFATVRVYGHKPEYKIELHSEVLDIISPENEYIQDTEGKYVYQVGEHYVYSEGVDGCRSEGWLIYSDWETGEEVDRVQLSTDYYYAKDYVIYVGVHTQTGTTEEY